MKEWKDLTLTDDYLFSQIMKDEDFCKLFLEMPMITAQLRCYNNLLQILLCLFSYFAIFESIVLLSDFLIDA